MDSRVHGHESGRRALHYNCGELGEFDQTSSEHEYFSETENEMSQWTPICDSPEEAERINQERIQRVHKRLQFPLLSPSISGYVGESKPLSEKSNSTRRESTGSERQNSWTRTPSNVVRSNPLHDERGTRLSRLSSSKKTPTRYECALDCTSVSISDNSQSQYHKVASSRSKASQRTPSDQVRHTPHAVSRSDVGAVKRNDHFQERTKPSYVSRESRGNGSPKVQGERVIVPGAGVWSEAEQNSRNRTVYSRQSETVPSRTNRQYYRQEDRTPVPHTEPIDRPKMFGNDSLHSRDNSRINWGEFWKYNAPSGWMPPFPTGNSVRSWIEEVAYEAAVKCGGDENVQKWVLEIMDIDSDGYNLSLPQEDSWRALDINIADEIKSIMNNAGDKYQTIRGNITLLKRRAMRERRILGGREIMTAVVKSYGTVEKRNSMNDLMLLKTPTIKTLEQFYIDWKDILIDVDERDQMHEIKVILEQKLDESTIFEHELRTIDLWDLPDDETYRTYTNMIEKRILKENKKMNEGKKKNTTKNASEQHNPISGDDDRRERRTQPRREDLPPVRENTQKYEEQFEDVPQYPPVPRYSKGKGKGKSKGKVYESPENPISINPVLGTYRPPNRGGLDDELLLLCDRFRSCYDYANGDCRKYNCRFHHMTRDEMKNKSQPTAQNVQNASE